MSAIVRLIVSNWPLKLTALGLATVLYMGVAISQSTQTWSGPVTIEVLNPPAGGALLSDPGVVDRIEFQAPDGVAAALTNDSFRASIDLRSVQPRPGATTVEVPVRVYPVDPRVRVVSYRAAGRHRAGRRSGQPGHPRDHRARPGAGGHPGGAGQRGPGAGAHQRRLVTRAERAQRGRALRHRCQRHQHRRGGRAGGLRRGRCHRARRGRRAALGPGQGRRRAPARLRHRSGHPRARRRASARHARGQRLGRTRDGDGERRELGHPTARLAHDRAGGHQRPVGGAGDRCPPGAA